MSEGGMGDDRGAAAAGAPSALHVGLVLRTDGFPDGMASTNRARLLSQALSDAGADVHVFCTQANESAGSPRNRSVSGRIGAVGFEYTTGRTQRPAGFVTRRLVDLRGFVILVRRLRSLRALPGATVCYSWITPPWNPAYHSATMIALNLLGIPCVMELNEPAWAFGAGTQAHRKAFSTLRGMSGVVAISAALEAWAREESGDRGAAIPVLRIPAVSSSDMQVANAADRPARPRVVLACSPDYRGRIMFLLHAMERVWEERDCDLFVAGFDESDPRAAWLESEPAYVRNKGRITLAGHLDAEALAQRYASAAVLAAPLDDNERSAMAFPTKVAEYLMTGRPVVTSEVGDAGRMLRESGGAYLAPAGDCESFADCLLEILADPEKAEEVGRRGRETALRHLDASCYGEPLARFMADIAAARRAR